MVSKFCKIPTVFKFFHHSINEKSLKIWGSVALLQGFLGKEAHLEQQKIVQNQKFLYFLKSANQNTLENVWSIVNFPKVENGLP